jgi:flavin-dependent dehydrogenase
MKTREHDVLILGSGIAGSCMARQLRLTQPELSVAIVDERTEFNHFLGESSIDGFVDYAYRNLKLGRYFAKRHMPKHAFRFFADNEARTQTVSELSEFGVAFGSPQPSIQLDRKTFDTDMDRFNRELGVDCNQGVRVENVKIDGKNGHIVDTTAGQFKATYLVDTTGRGAFLGAKKDLFVPEPRLNTGVAWGVVDNVIDVEEFADEAFMRRVQGFQRFMSTLHFMYEGYWIWFIPLSETETSIGVQFDRGIKDLDIKNEAELMAFFREHRALRDMLSKASCREFHGMKNFARRATQCFFEDRFYLTGTSAFQSDAMFSHAGHVLASGNVLSGELIKTDRAGDQALLRSQLSHFNGFMQSFYDIVVRVTSQTYKFGGSFEVWHRFVENFAQLYFNRPFWEQTRDYSTLLAVSKEHVEHCNCPSSKTMVDEMANDGLIQWANELCDTLKAKGRYREHNRGEFQPFTAEHKFIGKVWHARSMDQQEQEDLRVYIETYREFVGRVAELEGVEWNEAAFVRTFVPDYRNRQTLHAAVDAMRAANG